jgi:hypothetical protein
LSPQRDAAAKGSPGGNGGSPHQEKRNRRVFNFQGRENIRIAEPVKSAIPQEVLGKIKDFSLGIFWGAPIFTLE